MARIRKTIRIGGKRVSQYFRTKELAERWYRAMVDRKDAARGGVDLALQPSTLMEQARLFIAKRSTGKSVVNGTFVNDEGRMRLHVLPKFGDRVLSEITAAEWEEFFKDLVTEKGLSKATSNRVRALVSKLYSDALRSKPPVVLYNPIARTVPFPERLTRIAKIKDNYFKTKQEMQRYLLAAREEDPGYLIFHVIGFNTGLRTSQKIPLKWKDYDPSARLITVRRAYEPSNNSIREGSKGFEAGADYTVGVNDTLANALAWWRGESRYVRPDDFICSRSNGKHLHSWHLRKAHARILKRAGLPTITPHGIRHTYATHYLDAGGSTENLQRILGHKDITTTQIYTHVLARTLPTKANILNVAVKLPVTVSPMCHQNGKKRSKTGGSKGSRK